MKRRASSCPNGTAGPSAALSAPTPRRCTAPPSPVATTPPIASEAKLTHKNASFIISGTPNTATKTAVVTFMRNSEFVDQVPALDFPTKHVNPHVVMLKLQVNPVEERQRLQKEIARVEGEI